MARYLNDLIGLLRELNKEFKVFVPVRDEDRSHFYQDFSSLPEGAEIFMDHRCSMSPKAFFFPMREKAASYPGTDVDPSVPEPALIFGVRGCDLKALQMMDQVFLEEGDVADPFYKSRRENAVLVAVHCGAPGPNCFCNLVGVDVVPKEGYDLHLTPLDQGFVVQAGSPKGEEILSKHSGFFVEATDAQIKEREAIQKETNEILERQNAEYQLSGEYKGLVEELLNDEEFWTAREAGGPCVECNACTLVCPTCRCFLLYDTRDKDTFGRTKVWDACNYPMYARVGGGSNPMRRFWERFRHRYYCKFSVLFDRYGFYGCVGCGRCIENCMGKIDMRSVMKKGDEHVAKQPV
jgi:ferredoxin